MTGTAPSRAVVNKILSIDANLYIEIVHEGGVTGTVGRAILISSSKEAISSAGPRFNSLRVSKGRNGEPIIPEYAVYVVGRKVRDEIAKVVDRWKAFEWKSARSYDGCPVNMNVALKVDDRAHFVTRGLTYDVDARGRAMLWSGMMAFEQELLEIVIDADRP